MENLLSHLHNWWRELIVAVGAVGSFLTDSRVLTAVTILYTLYIFGMRVYRDWIKKGKVE